MKHNYAYTTLLGSDDYLIPVLGLYHSWELSQSKYEMIVMVMDTVSPSTIETLFTNNIPFRVFPNLQSNANLYIEQGGRVSMNQNDLFQIMMMNKFYMFDLKEYDKVCYLDGDMIILQNIDFVFNYRAPAGKILQYEPPAMVAGEIILINPKDSDIETILEEFTVFGFDEAVLRTIYPISKITNLKLSDWNHLILHAHAHCNHFRYWNYFDLEKVDKCYRFIEMLIDSETSEQGRQKFSRNKDICGKYQNEFFNGYNDTVIANGETDSEEYRDFIYHNPERYVQLYKQFILHCSESEKT